MSNNYFQFKQFTVYQDKCAMKVCTDACLFGSLTPALPEKELKILDIGTGTGLLALMYAQQYPNATIDAVEIEEAAAQQAAKNFAASPWPNRLTLYNSPIQQCNPATGYDIIISNPPFFDNDLKSTDAKRNVALHGEALSLEELLASIDRLLNPDGCFGVLLPFHRTEYFDELSTAKQFYLSQKILVKQTPAHRYFRSILFFSRTKTEMAEKEITIKDADGQYSSDFKALLKDYYLHL